MNSRRVRPGSLLLLFLLLARGRAVGGVAHRQAVDARQPHRIFGLAHLLAILAVIFAQRVALALEAHMRDAPAATGLDLIDLDDEDLPRAGEQVEMPGMLAPIGIL